MTTEGDGNYQLQRFLESEGAEGDIQLVTAWLLYSIWEVAARHERAQGSPRRGHGKYGLGGMGPFGVAQKLVGVARGGRDRPRACFQAFAHAAGLYDYHLPDMDRDRRGQPRATTTTISAAAKATWRSASSS